MIFFMSDINKDRDKQIYFTRGIYRIVIGIFRAKTRTRIKTFPRVIRIETRLIGERRGSKKKKKKEREKEKGTRDENVFAYEIKWRIYTERSPVRPIVNYTVNRGVLFDQRGKEDLSRARDTRTRTRSRTGTRRKRRR